MPATGLCTPQANALSIGFHFSTGGEELHQLIEIEPAAMTIAEDRIAPESFSRGLPQSLHGGGSIQFHQQIQHLVAVNSLIRIYLRPIVHGILRDIC